MERHLPLPLPERQAGSFAAFLRQRASADPAEKTWVCPTCGTMPPREIKPGLYLRRSCACEERQREAREVEALRQQRQEHQRTQTFGWLGHAWVAPHLEALTFATFERSRHPHAFNQAQAFALTPQGTLALTGSYGTGKTHLLVAIAHARQQANLPCLYASAIAFFEAIGQRIHRQQEYVPLIQRAARTPLLLLDDLDKPKHSAFRESVFYEVFNQRWLARLPTAFTCNCHPRDLERWMGGAVLSRLMHGLLPLQMDGPDARLAAIPPAR